MNLLPLICDRRQRLVLILLPVHYLPIQTQWQVLAKFKRYFEAVVFLISDVNITGNFSSFSFLSSLFTSVRLFVLLWNQSSEEAGYKSPPERKIWIAIHFLLTDDTEWCIACRFTWFIKNTQREKQMQKGDGRKAIWNLLNVLLYSVICIIGCLLQNDE